MRYEVKEDKVSHSFPVYYVYDKQGGEIVFEHFLMDKTQQECNKLNDIWENPRCEHCGEETDKLVGARVIESPKDAEIGGLPIKVCLKCYKSFYEGEYDPDDPDHERS